MRLSISSTDCWQRPISGLQCMSFQPFQPSTWSRSGFLISSEPSDPVTAKNGWSKTMICPCIQG